MAGQGTQSSTLQRGLSKFRQILTYVDNDYVDEVDTEAILDEAITTMLEKLDPHTSYISKEDREIMRSQLEGNFEGIGIEFNIFKDTIHVVAPLSGGPSIKVGLQSGDKIVKVDNELVAGVGFQNRDVINRLRGKKGSVVVVTIKRKGVEELMDFSIERDVIPQFSLDVAYMVDEKVGYMKISRFSATTYIEFKEGLRRLTEEGMEQLILDLTGNPGGYLDRAVDLVDELLEDDKIIVYTQGKEDRYNEKHYSKKGGDFEDGSLILLIDEGSASASEIVSGAIQDHDRGLIVGRRSYGKGLVQLPISLDDGSELRLTISRYYTPSGRCIQKPYTEDIEEYHNEYSARFESGEVYNADSIKVNDSLVFHTSKGRVVYGGGGIVPDHFVPIDTTINSPLLNRLFSSNSIAEFSLGYFEEHREKLEKMGLKKFISSFDISDKILKDFLQSAKTNGVVFSDKELNKSEGQIKTFLKANIGRGIWNNEGFYPVVNEQNKLFQTALNLFEEADRLNN